MPVNVLVPVAVNKDELLCENSKSTTEQDSTATTVPIGLWVVGMAVTNTLPGIKFVLPVKVC